MRAGRLAFVLVLCVSAAALAVPQISVSESVWDFGAVESGAVLTHTFVLGNAGSDPLVIDRVTTSCGCTTAPLATPYTLNPGETVDLAVTLHVSGTGSVSRMVTITSNDPASPLYLTVKALASAVPAVSPADLLGDAYLLIDLRSPGAYADGHILGAMSFPYADLATWAETLPADALVILYDGDGVAAADAVRSLRDAGVPQSFYLAGGYSLWQAAHPSLCTAASALSEVFVAPASEPTTSSPELLAVDVADLRSIFTLLVDLRSANAFASSHLAGALNVPPDGLVSFASSLSRDLDILLYGEADEARSAAGVLLSSVGMTKVTALAGGLTAWRASYGDLLLVRSD